MNRQGIKLANPLLGLALLAITPGFETRNYAGAAEPWPRHVIDDTSRGADGVRLADFNGDGLADMVTGWEEGGVVRIYLHPGMKAVKEPWPRVTLGKARSPEDAFATDLDNDGSLDVISCHEGKEQTVWFHWGPLRRQDSNIRDLLNEENWTSRALPATKGKTRWMYGVPMQVDGAGGIDLVLGSKSPNGMVCWLQSPQDPRNLKDWSLHKIQDAGWIMSLEVVDMNGDGQEDIFVTDRKGSRRGAYWLEKQTSQGELQWKRHDIGLSQSEVMFAQALVINKQTPSLWVSTRNNEIYHLYQHPTKTTWGLSAFPNPFDVSAGKAVAVANIGDGRFMFAHTSNTAAAGLAHKKPGVSVTIGRLNSDKKWQLDTWKNVSGLEGVKFDRIELLDLDQDGDLDIVTCEERDNLGLIWYEHP